MRTSRGQIVGGVLVAGLLATALTAGCGHPADGGRGAGPTGGGPSRRSFDPPTKFQRDGGVKLPDAASVNKISLGGQVYLPFPVLLYKTTLFVAGPDQLQVVDTATGAVRGTVKPQHEPVNSPDHGPWVGANKLEPPVLAQLDGRSFAVTPFLVRVPGEGTTPARRIVELVGVDVDTGRSAWTVPVELSSWVTEELTEVDVSAVGVHGTTLAMRVVGAFKADTYAVDLAARKVLWSKSFNPDLMVGDVLVAGGPHGAVALSVAEGQQRWTARKDSSVFIRAGGPNLIVATGQYYDGGKKYFFDLLDPATGTARYSDGGGGSGDLRCQYDDQSLTVCWQGGSAANPWAGAFDASTGKWLWQLPDKAANRVAPVVTAAWHGMVYGTTGNGPVVLDGHTGADRETSPGVAPYVVDGYLGIAHDETAGGLGAYPAVG